MSTQPEALRLADELERDKWHVSAVVMQAAADELRRLHDENETLDKRLEEAIEDMKAMLKTAPWTKCRMHGAAHQSEWACPSCLRELRAEVERLTAHIVGQNKELDELIPMAEKLETQKDALLKDKERLDWLQRAADKRKIELARSIYKTGYEIGEWPSMKVTVKSGSLRDAIDAAIAKAEGA